MHLDSETAFIMQFMEEKSFYKIMDENSEWGDQLLSVVYSKEEIKEEQSHYDDRYCIDTIAIESYPDYKNSWEDLIPVARKLINENTIAAGVSPTFYKYLLADQIKYAYSLILTNIKKLDREADTVR